MKNTIISTKGIIKTYISDEAAFNAVNDVSINIYEKDFTIIMGSSGSGKSTLLYLLSGLDNISSGEVWFENFRIDLMKEKEMALFRRKSIGFVFQAINLIPNLTLLENVTIAGYFDIKNRSATDKRGKELLSIMGLDKEFNRLPSQVSGGQQQRAAIARGLINNPKVLFADEPTGSLNSSQSQNVLDVLTEINNEGKSIVMVTHDIKAAIRADRILFIKDGKIDGDLAMEKYKSENAEKRERMLFDYLTEKGW